MTFEKAFTNLNFGYFPAETNTFSSSNFLALNDFKFENLFNSFTLPAMNFDFSNIWNFNTNFTSFMSPISSNFMSPIDFKPSWQNPATGIKYDFVSAWQHSSEKIKTNFQKELTMQKPLNTPAFSDFKKYSSPLGTIDNSYMAFSRTKALQKAKSDSNLEKLKGGANWDVSESLFRTDIPYAKKGASKILDKVSDIVAEATGKKIKITSALGTGEAGNPHQKGGYVSHHNAENPKIDISTRGFNSTELANLLKSTGYFSHVLNEGDHLDVQIDPTKFESYTTVA